MMVLDGVCYLRFGDDGGNSYFCRHKSVIFYNLLTFKRV